MREYVYIFKKESRDVISCLHTHVDAVTIVLVNVSCRLSFYVQYSWSTAQDVAAYQFGPNQVEQVDGDYWTGTHHKARIFTLLGTNDDAAAALTGEAASCTSGAADCTITGWTVLDIRRDQRWPA